MSTEINVNVPYAGGSLASDVRTVWGAMDWCLIGGNNGRLGVTIRHQSNPNFLVCDVWELDEDRKTVDGRTILRKQLIQTVNNTDTSAQLSTCRLNDTTFAVHQTFSSSRNIRIISVDPDTYEVTDEKFAMMSACGDYRYSNRSTNMASYHSFQHFFMHPIEENKYLTWCGQSSAPHYRFVEVEWNPSDGTLGVNMICSDSNRTDASYAADWYRDNGVSGFDFGRDVAYLHEGGERYRSHNNIVYPTLHGNDNTSSSLFYTPTWIQSKKDRVGRVIFTCSYVQNGNGFESIQESSAKYWTLVYTPEAIRGDGEYPWTVLSGNGNFQTAMRGNTSNYSEENKLGFAGWLPLYTKELKDDGQPLATKGELYCSKNLLVGKNSFRVMESTPSIPYGNNSLDSINAGNNQRIIQSEWLDEDHFIVFYTNAANYPDQVHLGTNPNRGVRYKIVHLIDDYMANVVGYGEIMSPWFRGRPSEYMMPFKFSESNKVITSDAFQHLVSIWVPNSNPTVTNDTYTMVEDSVLTVSDVNLSVLVNDADLDGDTLTVSTNLVASPTFGSASMNADGTFTYTPNANFTGTDSFAYRALDGVGGFTDGVVYITVTPVADGPTAVSDVYTIAEDQTLTFSDINLGVLANDFDVDGDSLTIDTTPVNPPQNGSLTLNTDGTFHYTPNANFNGTDSFEYKVEDGTGNAESATVTINVTSVNDNPVAVSDSFTMNEDETLTSSVSLLVNDSDLDGDSLTVNTTPVADVVNGTLTLNADGTFTYAPPANHYGSELFTYEVSDGNGGTAQASVTITIYALNDTPIPVSDSYSVDENSSIDVSLSLGLIANDTDLDGDTLTVDTTPVVDVSNGTLVLSSDGTFTYTPYTNYYGSDSFTYRVTDGNGGAATTTVSITVTEVPNQAPVIAGVDSTYTLTQGQDTVITATATDIDGDAVTWSYEESLGSDSKYVFVGASYDDDNGEQSGSIYVYNASDLTATPTKLVGEGYLGGELAVNSTHLFAYDSQTVKAFDLSDLSAEPIVLGFDPKPDSFGIGIVCTTDKVLISAFGDDTVASNSGAIFVYDANDLSAAPIQLNGSYSMRQFGQYFTASDSKLIVGDPSWNNPNDQGGSHGAVDVYDMNNLSAPPTRIENHLLGHSQYLGKSMGISNGKIFIGNPGNGDHNNVGGSVLVYSESTLAFQQKITPPDAQLDGEFGIGITADSDYLVVTARKPSEQTGSVYVYDMNNLSGTPTKLTTSSTTDRFGYAAVFTKDDPVTIFDGSLYVSAERGSNNNGVVYIYDLNNLSAAPQELIANDANTYDNFGNSTAAITVTPSSQLNGVTVTQSDNVFTVTPGTADADFQLRITATDSEGNASSTTSDFDFTYVNQAPSVMGIEAVYTLTTGQDEAIVGLATDAEGDTITWSYEEVLAEGVPSGLNGTTITQNGSDFTITPGSADANFTLRFTATDSAGNETSTDADFSHTYVAPGPDEYLLAGTMWSEGTGVGSVKTFDTSGTLLQSVATPANITYGYANFGKIVATNGVKMAVGAPAEQDGGVSNHGEVTIFNIDGSSPISVIYEDGRDTHEGDEVGGALAMSDNYMYLGVPKAEQYGGGSSGIVAVYDLNGNLQSTLTAPNANASTGGYQFFGTQVGWTGSRMVASAPQNTGNIYWDCYFRVYEEDGTFVEQVELPNVKTKMFGEYMDVTGPECTSNKVVLSCRNGNAYVYDLDAADIAGSQVAITIGPDGTTMHGVAINDSYVYVGLGSSDTVKVYDHSGTFQFDIVPTSDVLTALGETTDSMTFGVNIEATNHHLAIVTGNNGKVVIYDTQGNNPVPFDTLGGSYGARWSGGMQFYQ
jgi:VCBS repeat-containing protein